MGVRVADYIINYLVEQYQVDTIFMVVGGGNMFLTDAIAQNKKIKYVCCHHEQAAAMAASGYSRYSGKLGVCLVTTGCGGTNAITGVLGAFQDRVPMLVLSGQSKTKECMQTQYSLVRQLGVQEANIIEIVEPITVYHEVINKKELVKPLLESACWTAMFLNGPAWLDIPLDIQGEELV